MNKILSLGTNEFQKSIADLKISDLESLLRLLEREIVFEKDELNRCRDLLNAAISKKNTLDRSSYEEKTKENEVLLENLRQKLTICHHEISKKKEVSEVKKAVNGPVPSSLFQNNSKSQTKSDGLQILPINAKSLITGYEKMSIVSSNTGSQDNSLNIKKKVTSQQSVPVKSALQFEAKQDNNPVLFTNVKLKAVGLPPDGKEIKSNVFLSENKIINNNQETQKIKNTNPKPELYFTKSPSVDFSANNNTLNIKDKFHNPNKDIQVAIQNEIKELKLKKTNVNDQNPPVICGTDSISFGKFNFKNEKFRNNSSINESTSVSASKSMPFLHNISTQNLSVELKNTPIPISTNNTDKSENSIDASNKIEASCITNWNPTKVLENLYDMNKQINETEIPSKNGVKNMSCPIDIIPGTVNRSSNTHLWKRNFVSISNGELKIFEDKFCRSPNSVFDTKDITIKKISEEMIELYDSRGLHSTIKFVTISDCSELSDILKYQLRYETSEVIPSDYDFTDSKDTPKIIIVDIGSCSIRAGLLKSKPTLPKIFIPNIAAVSESSQNVLDIGFDAVSSRFQDEYNIVRPLKPDTTIEHIAFTSGTVEFTFTKLCSLLKINPKEYIVMLSLPHNVAEATRTKLADVLFFRLNFLGVSMCGQSLLALHAYGEPTGVLVDIGYRTEILPVIHGIVQTSSAVRSIFGGHLIQIALSHLLPFELHSVTDFLLARYILEKVCIVAKNADEVEKFNEKSIVNLEDLQLPDSIPKSISVSGKHRCLPAEGLFNPEIYSLDDVPSLPKLLFKSIQSCPVDNRRDLYQSIYLSGALTNIPGLKERLESELKRLVPKSCEVKIYGSRNRAHFSYIGACFVALSVDFNNTVVKRHEWEESRTTALKKWHM